MAALLLCGTFFAAGGTAEAQTRQRRRVIIVPYRVYRPYRPFGWGWGGYYDPYGWNSYYSHYVFDSGEKAAAQGYKDGFKTGKDDGKKRKSYSPERSHYFREAGFGNFGEVYRGAFSRGYGEGYRSSNMG
jgi:hypothetical protein